jgi:MoxR-like ATPase
MTIPIHEIVTRSSLIIAQVEKAVVGKHAELEQIMAALLTPGGHVLLEDYPGVAKTLIANSFASSLGISFKRIQFTPDLLPGDITGGYVYDRHRDEFILRKGPLFANLILADEINRASPRTQSALLEAMQEYQVTIEGETVRLPEPLIVLATQNPIEYEGTFPLPEAQLDRFVMKLSIGYPSPADEQEILHRRRERKSEAFNLQAVASLQDLLEMRQAVEEIHLEADLERYIVELVVKTRQHRQVAVGASPRAGLALLKLSRAWAAMQGRSYVIPDDIKCFVPPVLSHRLILEPDLWAVHKASEEIIQEILESVPVPVLRRSS